MKEIKSYIITQNKEYFSKNSEYIKIKNSNIKKIIKNGNIINAFLYEEEKNKLYGYYKIDLNDLDNSKNKKNNDDFAYLKITDNYKRRRGIYYKLEKKYIDFSLFEIDDKTFLKLKNGLDLLNENISQTFFSCSIEKELEGNDIFKYKAIETSPSLYIAEYQKKFDYQAYKSIYKEYLRLLKTSNSENDNSQKFIEIGSYLTNMLIPEKEFRNHLLNGFRIVYLHLDENTYNIPWEILAYDKKFISEKIIFSYTNAVNILPENAKNKNNNKMAIVSIPDENIKNDKKEIEIIDSIKLNLNKDMNIDLYRKEHNYFDFIKVLENYDIVHIITHGYSNGIKLSEDYILNSISALENPPSLVFINACNMEENDNKLIQSLLSAGVRTVISGTGSLADGIYIDFIESFYSNLFHKYTRINTAQAYYLAYLEIKEFYNGFMRYRFNGVPAYV